MTTETRLAFRVRGTTDEITECELCGRTDLKGTVMLEFLDDDGNGTDEVVYYGAACAARAAGWTTREVRAAAKLADTERLAAERAQEQAEHKAWIAGRDTWIAENIGPDALSNPRAYGLSGPFAVVQAYRRAVGE